MHEKHQAVPGVPTVGTKFMLAFVMKCKIKIDYEENSRLKTSNIEGNRRSLMNKNTNPILGRKNSFCSWLLRQ